MTTATSSSALSQAAAGSPAGIQAWTGELVGQLIACGAVQTQDSGQLTISGSGATATTNAAQPTATGVASAVGHVLFTFTDTLAQGGITTTALVAGGAGGTNGTYPALTVTGVTSGAISARASVTVSGGIAGNMTITTAGSGYIAGEKLTVSNGNIPTAAAWMPTVMSSGSPVVFRLDFGAGSAVTDPQMWITVGAGSNGSSTINGSAGTSAMTQVACFAGSAPASTSTPYNSYFCYNTTYSTLWAAFKYGAVNSSNAYEAFGGFNLYRTSSNSGAATGSVICLITSAPSTANNTSTAPPQQCMTWASGVGSTIYPTLNASNSSAWNGGACQYIAGTNTIYGLSSTLENSNVFVFPTYTISPAIAFSAVVGMVLVGDVTLGTSFSCAIIGSTALTFLQVGSPFGITYMPGTGSQTTANASAFVFLYQ